MSNLFLDRVVGENNINSRDVVSKDILKEYAVDVDSKNNVYLLYQNQQGYLILSTIKNQKIESKEITETGLSEVYNLKIIIKNKVIHIFYMIKLKDKENKYGIFHIYYKDKVWNNNKVLELDESKIINPFTILEAENKLSLVFYMENKMIQIKNLNLNTLIWNEEKNITESENNKIFIDAIEILDTIHLTYCEFINERLVIKYNRINRIDNILHKEEITISNEGNASYPTIIYYDNRLWIVWIELNNIISRYSDDMGKTWSSLIYSWNKTKEVHFVRYRYINRQIKEGIVLNYSFGSIYPEINFLGFGDMEDTVEIPLKLDNLAIPIITKKGP